MDQLHKLTESTLDELRAVIAQADALPGDSVVRVRAGFGNGNGAKIKRIHLAAPDRPADAVQQ